MLSCKRYLKSVFLVLVCISFSTLICSCQNKSSTVDKVSSKSSLDKSKLVKEQFEQKIPEMLKQHRVPGLAVVLIDKGEIFWEKGFGLADISGQKEVNEKTIFNVASISKTVTTWGILKLVEEKKINLDEPVEKYLKTWKFGETEFSKDKVTVRRLLSHSAGINMPSIPGFPEGKEIPTLLGNLNGKYTGSIYAKSGTAVKIIKEPGEEFIYSGGAFVLLQLLIEDVSGMEFKDFMEKEVLNPLKMDSSNFGWDSNIEKDAAIPYMSNSKAERLFKFRGTAGAGLYSTVGDIGHFLAANIKSKKDNDVLKSETIKMISNPIIKTSGSGTEEQKTMGLGFYVGKSQKPDLTFISHSGGNAGWRARFIGNLEKEKGIVILTNSDNGGKLIYELICQWGEIEFGAGVLHRCEK